MLAAVEDALDRGVRRSVSSPPASPRSARRGAKRQDQLLALVRAHGAQADRPELPRNRGRRPEPERDIRARGVPPGHDRVLVAERRARPRAARGGRGARARPLGLRLDRQQGGRLVERPARVVGGRRGHGPRRCSTSSRSATRGGSHVSRVASRGEADPGAQERHDGDRCAAASSHTAALAGSEAQSMRSSTRPASFGRARSRS